MKSYFLITVTGPLVILTSYDSPEDPEFLKTLCRHGFSKFIAHELSLESVKAKYGIHFDIVCKDPRESNALRILDDKSERAYNLFSFKELGPPIYYESPSDRAEYLRVYPRSG